MAIYPCLLKFESDIHVKEAIFHTINLELPWNPQEGLSPVSHLHVNPSFMWIVLLHTLLPVICFNTLFFCLPFIYLSTSHSPFIHLTLKEKVTRKEKEKIKAMKRSVCVAVLLGILLFAPIFISGRHIGRPRHSKTSHL